MTPQEPSDTGDASPLLPEEGAALIAAALAPGEKNLVVAVSGGPDSTVLMHAVAALVAHGEGHRATIVSIDHGLRPESAGEAAEVVAQAGALGLPARSRRWEHGAAPVAGIQQAARAARYRLLADEARAAGAAILLTAHTADDQAETVLMRLCAGSGIDGIAGMAPHAPLDAITGPDAAGITLVRPFLGIAKRRLTAACARFGWWHVRDPANIDPRHTRARLRALLPVLAQEGLTPQRLARLARRAGETREALDHAAETLFAQAPLAESGAALTLNGAVLRNAPVALVQRVLRRAFIACGHGEVEANGYGPNLEKIEALARALQQALRTGTALPGRTLGGIRLACAADGTVSLTRARPRRTAQQHA